MQVKLFAVCGATEIETLEEGLNVWLEQQEKAGSTIEEVQMAMSSIQEKSGANERMGIAIWYSQNRPLPDHLAP